MSNVHFLNVGAGDCTIIEHASGNLTMVDINNGEDLTIREVEEIAAAYEDRLTLNVKAALAPLSGMPLRSLFASKGMSGELTNPIEFLHQRYPGRNLFRYIQTHPDLDHMRGLAALTKSNIKILNFWDCPHNKEPEFRNNADRIDWNAYLDLSSGRYGATVLHLTRGAVGSFYNRSADNSSNGDGITVLSPSKSFHADCRGNEDTNNSSYVLNLHFAGIDVILGGDAETEAWEEMCNLYSTSIFPSCSVLKASHHGRDSGYHQMAVKAMKPEYTIVSAGRKPDTEVTHKYGQYCKNVWTTRWMGNIHLHINDEGRGTITPDRMA